MFPKYLSLLLIGIAAPSFSHEHTGLAAAWRGSHYGECYPSFSAGMSDVYGPGYASDENIDQKRAKYGANEMVVSTDRTSGTNASRTVFERRSGGRWCVVLTSPPVASLVPNRTADGSRKPSQWTTLTQAPPGYPATEIVYLWNRTAEIYLPSHCYHVSARKKKRLNCAKAYE